MTKATIVKLFLGSLIGGAGGIVLLVVGVALAASKDVFVMEGPSVVGIRSGALNWTVAALVGLATLVLMCAAIVQFVAWVGAILNTANLPAKGWFVVVLVVGLLGFVFLATLVYVIAGPDGLRPQQQVSQGAAGPYPSVSDGQSARADSVSS